MQSIIVCDAWCRLVVVLKNRLFVYGIGREAGVERLMVFDTFDNAHGMREACQ